MNHINNIIKLYRTGSDKRITLSIPMILIVSLFAVWQMGIVFFAGDTLTLYGWFPIAVDERHGTAVIISAFVVSMAANYFFLKHSLILARIVLCTAFIATVILLLPLPPPALVAADDTSCFCCVFLIGSNYVLESVLYDNSSELNFVYISAIFAFPVMALLHNGYIQASFIVFNTVSMLIIAALIFAYAALPKYMEVETRTAGEVEVKKITFPLTLRVGLILMIGIITMLGIFSLAYAGTLPHGLFVFYLVGVAGAVAALVAVKKFNFSPFKICTVYLALSVVGFVCVAMSAPFKVLAYPAVVFLGFNCASNSFVGFFANTIFEHRRTKFIAILVPAVELMVVMMHAGILAMFRDKVDILFAVISAVAIVFTVFYLTIESSLTYSWRILKTRKGVKTNKNTHSRKPRMPGLSARDMEIVEHILLGYTVPEIARTLNLSDETVKGYKKNIYIKLDIHSKRELFALMEKTETPRLRPH